MLYLPPDTEPGEDAIMLTLFNPETYDPLNGVFESFTGDHSISIICNDTKKIEKKFLPVMDWHANSDEEGYISNRPMYKTTKEFVWLDETEVAEGQQNIAMFNGFSEGWANVENVKVIFDGVEHLAALSVKKETGNSFELVDKCFVTIQAIEAKTNDPIFGFLGWVYGFEEQGELHQFHKTGTIKIILTIAEYKTLPYEFENKSLDLGNSLLSTETISNIVEALRIGKRVYGKFRGEDVEVFYASYSHEPPVDYVWKCRTLDGMKQYEISYEGSNPIWTTTVTEAITAPETAQVGQAMAVKAVDDSGRPIEWEPVSYLTEVPDGYVKTIDGYTPDENGDVSLSKEYMSKSEANRRFSQFISKPTKASVGQIMAIKSVDSLGKPMQWETIYPFQIITWEADD